MIRCGSKALKVNSHFQYQGEDFNPDFTSLYLASVSVWQFFVVFFFFSPMIMDITSLVQAGAKHSLFTSITLKSVTFLCKPGLSLFQIWLHELRLVFQDFSLLLRPKGHMSFAFFLSSRLNLEANVFIYTSTDQEDIPLCIHVVEYISDPMNGMKAAAFFQGKYHSPLLHACVDLRVAALWLCFCRHWL